MSGSGVTTDSDNDVLVGRHVDPETSLSSGQDKSSKPQKLNDGLLQAKAQARSTAPRYYERQLGVWTLYSPISDKSNWRPKLAGLPNLTSTSRNARHVKMFLAETFSLGPLVFIVYLVTLVLSRSILSLQLYSNSRILSVAEQTLSNHTERTLALTKFKQGLAIYLLTIGIGSVTKRLQAYSRAILEQRVTVHFTRRILSVRSRLDLSSTEDPAIQSLMKRATNRSASAWALLDGLANLISAFSEVVILFSTLRSMLASGEDVKVLSAAYLLAPVISELYWLQGQIPYYAITTNIDWLRMRALVSLGSESSYRKEVLSCGLEDHIDSEYAKSMSRLRDTLKQGPGRQLNDRRLFHDGDISNVFDPLPLFVYACKTIQDRPDLSLSDLVMMQQATKSLRSVVSRVVYRGRRLSNLFENLAVLYKALGTRSSLVDGYVAYPDEEHVGQNGMGIEFRNVNFGYPSSKKAALTNMSFTILPGQLCVIVGENGCGKSTTIGLITRLYDSNSGDVLIDGRPVHDFQVSTLRAAANIMYQDYHHLPLTIKENILLGRPDSENPVQEVEDAAKLGGAYEFVQKLPRKFETNLEPEKTGYPSWSGGGNSPDKYKGLVDTERDTKLSGGEWQRLALSRTFMRNSEKTRLLCYDEPTASLDPKAEYELFERLRELRGKKTMIFVTHRFGHLTKHADLIIYVKDGSVIEQGTHQSLLAQGGEYTKMYSIQSRAFSEVDVPSN